MREPWMARARGAVVALGTAIALIGCQLPSSTGSGGVAPRSFGLDAVRLVDALAAKPNRNWQDTLLSYGPLRQRMQERQRYSLAATGSLAWNYNLGTASSNAPCYAKGDLTFSYPGPSPAPDDLLYVLTDNAKVFKFDPNTGAAPTQSPAGALPSSYSKSALSISGDNRRLYAISAGGHFSILDADTLAQRWSQNISFKGFAGTAPYIDYGLNTSGGNTQFGSIEHVFCVSKDGSVYHLLVDDSGPTLSVTVNACPASSGQDLANPKPVPSVWATKNTLTLPASNVVGFPVAWKGHLYFGNDAGQFFDVNATNLNAPVVAKSWNLALNTTATGTGRGVWAPAALDFDGNFDVNAVFASSGDRLNWLNPQTGAMVPSASLTLDRSKALTTPAAAAPPVAGPLTGYTPASTSLKTYNPDWVSIKKTQLPNPTRWGGPLPTLGGNVAATSVRIDSTGDVWVCNYSASNVTVYHANGTPANVIPVSANPTKLEFDSQGFCWVSCSGFATNGSQGKVEKINVATETKVGGAFPVTFTGAVYIAPDSQGYCWVTDPYGGRVQCIQPNGSLCFSAAISLATAAAVFVDPNDVCWVSGYGSTQVRRYQRPAGPYPKAAPAVMGTGGTITVGNTPFGIAFRTSVTPPEAWVCLNGASKIQKVNMTTGALIGAALPTSGTGPSSPWAIRFDSAGHPWTSNTQLSSTAVRNVTELDLNGNVVGAPYDMSAYGNGYELVIDSTDTVYVACSAPNFSTGALVNIPNLGNTGDLFGTSYRGAVGDGDNSYGFLHFKWANGAFANQPVTRARLSLTQANVPNGGSDNLTFFGASFLNPTTGTPYTGYAGTPNVDWSNRPTVGNAFFSATGVAPGVNNAYTVDVPPPSDAQNYAGDTNTHYGLAVQSTNKALKDTIHWYTDTTTNTVAQLPTLNVTLDPYAQLSTTQGIACQPTVNSNTGHVYLVASNALWDLDFNSPQAFQMPGSTYYNFTQGGGPTGGGPVNTAVTPKVYLNPVGNALLTLGNRVVVPDFNSSTNQLFLNNFDVNLAPTSNRLVTTLDLAPGTGNVGAQMVWDYENGSAYVVTSNNYVLRAKIMQ